MAYADRAGRARTDPTAPRAHAICDDCGVRYNRSQLVPAVEWTGTMLQATGMLVCHSCNDKPNDQLRSVILPPDPVPVYQPRSEFFDVDRGTLGFAQYSLVPAIMAGRATGASGPGTKFILTEGFGLNPGSTRFIPTLGYGSSQSVTSDPSKPLVLAAVAALSGIATPNPLTDDGSSIVKPSVAQQLAPANAARAFLLIYNPAVPPLAVSTGTAAFGGASTVVLGPGEALLWATAQGGVPVYQGAMTVVGYFAGQPFYTWEA